jgi:hypothetical protein
MDEKQIARKVGYVSAMCIAIGVFLGWGAKIQFNLGWWIVPVTSVVMGSLAWLMCDFAGVITGVKQALREVTGWKPDRARVIRFFKLWFYWWMTFAGGMIWLSCSLNFLISLSIQEANGPGTFVVMIAMTGLSLGLTLLCAGDMSKEIGPPERPNSSAVMEFARDCALYCNPISLPFVAVYFLAKGLIWVTARIPKTTVIIASGVCRLVIISFILIHNDERRICFTATGLGTAIGLITCYQHGYAFYGAVIGSVVGIILGRLECGPGKRWADQLSTRWLKESAV